jgi:hypothetical protein
VSPPRLSLSMSFSASSTVIPTASSLPRAPGLNSKRLLDREFSSAALNPGVMLSTFGQALYEWPKLTGQTI